MTGRAKVYHHERTPETDTASFPFWGINVSEMTIYPHDVHGRQTGPAEKVKDIQEAFDKCEARNYPGRSKA